MILDTIDNKNCYTALNSKFKSAFAFLEENNLEDLQVGRYEIDKDEVYALVQSNITKNAEDNRFEAHKKYIDIQYIVKGAEMIAWAPVKQLTLKEDRFEERDIAFYEETDTWTGLNLKEGYYAIFFPEDGHKPGCKYGPSSEVKKVVIKIRV